MNRELWQHWEESANLVCFELRVGKETMGKLTCKIFSQQFINDRVTDTWIGHQYFIFDPKAQTF